MNRINRYIKTALSTLFIGMSSLVFSQAAAPVVVAEAEIDRPIYEELGMSPTLLASIMIIFTAILVGFVISLAGSTKNVLEFKRSKMKDGVKMLLVLFGLGFAPEALAADGATGSEYLISFPDSAFWVFFTLDVILVMIILYLTGIIRGVTSEYRVPEKMNLFARWNKSLNDFVPVEEEHKILMDHDYDGIKELDNNLPPWWKYGFYITVVWGFGYLAYYHVFGGTLQEAEYVAEMEAGDKADAEYKKAHPELITAENVTLLTDPSAIAQGKATYDTYCKTCHMENGMGGVGPNLTDNSWIYGGDIKGVFTTVSEGAKNGMVAWKDMLPANEIQNVSSYILQLEYIAPPTGKAPQGDNIVE